MLALHAKSRGGQFVEEGVLIDLFQKAVAKGVVYFKKGPENLLCYLFMYQQVYP